jgi:hypothetical protein
MASVDDDDLVSDDEVVIAAPSRVVFNEHLRHRDNMNARRNHCTDVQGEVHIPDARPAIQHGLTYTRALLARERSTAAALLGCSALADLTFAPTPLGHSALASAPLLADLALGPLAGRGLPVALSLSLPRGLLSRTLIALTLSLAARTRLLAALALFAEVALLALPLASCPFVALPAALALDAFSAFALTLGLARCAAALALGLAGRAALLAPLAQLTAALAGLSAALALRSWPLLTLGLGRASLAPAPAPALPLLCGGKHGSRSDGGGCGCDQQLVPHQAILLDFAARARRVLGTVQRQLLSLS